MENIIQPNRLLAASRTFEEIVDFTIADILQPLIALIVAIAVVGFLWGVSKYILHGGDEAKRTEGTHMMIYGVVVLFIMVSVWGFVTILQQTFFGATPIPTEIPFIT